MDNPTRGEGKALLMIDLVNPFDYPGAELVLEQARGIVEPLHALAERFRKGAGPVIYVNDNFGRWRSSFHDTVTHCLEGKGKDVVKRLAPREHDLFVLKPHRSGFYNTPLELLLQHEKVGHLVLAGLATDMCVLATASDAHMRGFGLTVVSDGTAAMDRARQTRTLALMEHAFDATIAEAKDC